jgi:HEAT repeat protein
MRKRSILIGVVIVVVLVVVALYEPTGIVRGFARGEPFFENRPASTWAKRLHDENPKAKEDARRSLKNGGPAAVIVLAAIVQAPAGEWESGPVRVLAADLLAEAGPNAAAAIPALTEALADRDPSVRSHAAEALGTVGPNDPRAVIALTAQLGTADALAAAKGLAKCGAAALPATGALVKLLKSPDAEVRWNAVKTLGKIRAADALEPLMEALADSNDLVREHAAESLGDLGPAAAPAVGRLTETLKDPYVKARRDAARALGLIGPAAKPAVPALQSLAKDDPEAIVRQAAEIAVKKLGG